MKTTFTSDKVTKNTIRFNEVLASELDAPVIGTVYVPKQTLAAIGWKEGAKLTMEIAVAAPAKAAKAAKAPAKSRSTRKAKASA